MGRFRAKQGRANAEVRGHEALRRGSVPHLHRNQQPVDPGSRRAAAGGGAGYWQSFAPGGSISATTTTSECEAIRTDGHLRREIPPAEPGWQELRKSNLHRTVKFTVDVATLPLSSSYTVIRITCGP